MLLHRHLDREHRVPASHSAVECHGRALSGERLESGVRSVVPWQAGEQPVDVRSVPFAAVQRVRDNLADDLVMLRAVR